MGGEETITVAEIGDRNHPDLTTNHSYKNQGESNPAGTGFEMLPDVDDETPWRDERLLQKIYAWEGLSVSEIARRFDCSERTVENWLDQHNVQKPWEDEATLRYLRFKCKLSQYEIAQRLGCTQGTVSHRFDEFGIDGSRFVPDQPWHDEATLRELYHGQELSMREVASELGCGRQSIEKWIHHHDIETRSPNPETPSQLESKEQLRNLYHSKGLSTYAIAERLSCAASTVHDWLERHSIETRDVGSQPGELHHRWEGGFEQYYGENWHETRRIVLRRDQYRCQQCGVTEPEHRREHSFGLDVHHIEPLSSFENPEEANQMENLIALCRRCHNGIDSRRDKLGEKK